MWLLTYVIRTKEIRQRSEHGFKSLRLTTGEAFAEANDQFRTRSPDRLWHLDNATYAKVKNTRRYRQQLKRV